MSAGIFDRLTTANKGSEPFDSDSDSDSDSYTTENTVVASADQELTGAGHTPRQLKDTLQELLKYGLLEASRKPNLYRTATACRDDINVKLEPLDLSVKIDEIRGLAFLVVRMPEPSAKTLDDDDWSHPLMHRQRLTLAQSLLVAILRQQYVAHEQQSGIGTGAASVALDELLSQLQIYLGDMGSDAQEQKRLRALLEALKGHGIVSEVDSNDNVIIRPIITHLANPENLQNLLHLYRSGAAHQPAQDER